MGLQRNEHTISQRGSLLLTNFRQSILVDLQSVLEGRVSMAQKMLALPTEQSVITVTLLPLPVLPPTVQHLDTNCGETEHKRPQSYRVTENVVRPAVATRLARAQRNGKGGMEVLTHLWQGR